MSTVGSGSPDEYAALSAALSKCLHVAVDAEPARRVRGGCINECFRWETRRNPVFVKIAPPEGQPMLAAEAEGLQALARANAVRVPQVLAIGATGRSAFLALEWIDLASSTARADAELGRQLATQHRALAERFGWHRDNTIGSTPQVNDWTASWPTFFRERRLKFQLDLAARNGHGGRLQDEGAALLARIEAFFEDHRPQPSLLHGDLWGGNAAVDPQGRPVIFDPAVYYGDREADLAMTRLFGGFGASFHSAYDAAWPLPKSAASRVDLYNLYHVLNHLNLFGGAYLSQAGSMIARLLEHA